MERSRGAVIDRSVERLEHRPAQERSILERLAEQGWLTPGELRTEVPFNEVQIDFESVAQWRLSRLSLAMERARAAGAFDQEEFALPRYDKVGGSFEREVAALEGRILVTLDGVFPNDGDVREHVGAEYAYRRLFALRAGYKANYDAQGPTFGAGFWWRDIAVDYAYVPSDELGDNHRFGLGFSF